MRNGGIPQDLAKKLHTILTGASKTFQSPLWGSADLAFGENMLALPPALRVSIPAVGKC